MPRFLISAKVVSFVQKEIEAPNKEEAGNILVKTLANGEMPEVDAWIEGEAIAEAK